MYETDLHLVPYKRNIKNVPSCFRQLLTFYVHSLYVLYESNFSKYSLKCFFFQVVQSSVLPDMFKSTYNAITKGNPMWNQLPVPATSLYEWDTNSTYIHEPPYFKTMTMSPRGPHSVKNAYCLLNFGDSITTDHISPAGSIHKDSPAAKYLLERGVDRRDFNSYGSRRGNDEIMARGTFANIRLVNKLLKGEVGPKTIHIPTGEKLYVFDAAMVSFYEITEIFAKLNLG